ncbi:helix-turn-helix domain-containing protein [Enterococcus xiangfangensis]|uniref:helix-turn-helix domain-containing protein n=1 Tax=Enterococcus xiangfangensis TaxID=1296537 RepID=UPI003D17632A|nr:XRE family transcriptional regulator [Enterococcus asini]
MRTNEEIIDLLTRIKDDRNLSISEIARRVGMAKSAVSRYFNKTREFPLNRVDDFAKALGVSSEYLLGISTNKSESSISKKLNSTFDELNKDNQLDVLNFAQYKLNEQNKEYEIYTLAAHSDDPDKEVTQEDLDNINSVLDELDRKFDKK